VRLRPFLTPKWLLGHVLVALVLVSFTSFGFWQLRRHEARLERNELASARLAAAPLDVAGVLALADDPRAGEVPPLAYRRVRLTGTFEPEYEVLRRPVARDGAPGYAVVTPFVLDDGRAVLVERGWVPQALDRVPVREAPPPEGIVTIEGWTLPTERPPTGALAAIAPRDPPSGRLVTVAYVDEERLADQVPHPLAPVQVILDVPPRAPGDRTLPLPPVAPEFGIGAHLGYAIQWFAFVLITAIGYTALVRRVARGDAGGRERTDPAAP
jgi:cytochrome oxidase assembly protein ShyY1